MPFRASSGGAGRIREADGRPRWTFRSCRGQSESSLGVRRSRQTVTVRKRAWQRLADVAIAIVLGAWFLGALSIVTDWMHVEPRRSNLWILMLVFAGPIFALIAVDELVEWIRNGPRSPGRHRRDPDADQP